MTAVVETRVPPEVPNTGDGDERYTLASACLAVRSGHSERPAPSLDPPPNPTTVAEPETPTPN